MRHLWALLAALLLLTGCTGGRSPVQEALDFRAELIRAGGCSFTAEVTGEFPDRAEVFTLACRGRADGSLAFTVQEPESLRGITAEVSQAGGRVTYEGMAVEFGLLAGGNVIPAGAPGLLYLAWREDYIAGGGRDGSLYRASYEKDYGEKRLNIDTRFQNNIPISGEICYNGARILEVRISDFQLN